MRRVGEIKYELTEDEYNTIRDLIGDVNLYFSINDYKVDAKLALEKLERMFE